MSAVYPDRSVSLKYYPKFNNLQVFLAFSFFFLTVYGAFLAFHTKPPAALSINLHLGSVKEQEMGHMATVCQ